MAYRIIAFDGGGIRGLVSALLLQDLERRGISIAQADMFAGTSTGSFLAIGMARQIDLGDIIDLYEKDGENIFKEASFSLSCLPFAAAHAGMMEQAVEEGWWEDFKAIFQAKYLPDNLRTRLESLFGPGDLGSLSAGRQQVAANSLQLWSDAKQGWRPVTLGSAPGDSFTAMSLADAALCSGAAPTYFPPHAPVSPSGQDWGYFADGGLFANNPSASAIAYAVGKFAANVAEIRVLSIGTGQTTLGIPPSVVGSPQCWGGWSWLDPYSKGDGTTPAAPLIEASLSASASACGEYAHLMLGQRYVRANLDLKTAYALDNWQDIQQLIDAVNAYIDTPAWRDTVKAAQTYWAS